MKRLTLVFDCLMTVVLILLVNAGTIPNIIRFGMSDAALVESINSGEDELRYLAKINEASEGRWLMANPAIKEYRDTGFSPSGFMEWLPALMLRILNDNWALVLLLTDLLCTGIVIILTRLWLGKLLHNPIAVWACMFALFFTSLGGSLNGLLRDVVPKFVQPFASLYLLLLTRPDRNTLRQTIIRSALVGIMFYTYPYHWTLFIVCEAVLFLYRIMPAFLSRTSTSFMRLVIPQAAATGLPFIVLALPMAIAMRIVLAKPGLEDFYARYHIVFTHIPAAPKLQAIVLMALIILVAAALLLGGKQRFMSLLQGRLLPLIIPMIAMMLLLNSNVITGKDPEWLGHGGRVIMPIVVASFFVAAEWALRKKTLIMTASIGALLFFFAIGIKQAIIHATLVRTQHEAWVSSPEKQVLAWLDTQLPPEQIIAAPRSLSEVIPVFTSHYLSFNAAAHFFFVSTDELVDRYLGWVGLYPSEQEPTDTATVIIFGNHPGAQWSKERTLHNILSDEPFGKTMADYIPRQDVRRLIDEKHANPDHEKTRQRLDTYNVDIVITKNGVPAPDLLEGFERAQEIGPYVIWQRS